MEQNLATMLKGNSNPFAELDRRIEKLQEEIIRKFNIRYSYTELVEELNGLRQQRQSIQANEAEYSGFEKRLEKTKAHLQGVRKEIDEYDETLVRICLEKITVFEDSFEMTFKIGIIVEISK